MAAILSICAASMAMNNQFISAEEETSTELTIYEGVKVGEVEIGGMTKDEAETAVNSYITNILNTKITLSLDGSDDKKIELTAGDLGLSWSNQSILEEAVNLGKSGNVIKRYKVKKDIANSQVSYEMEFQINTQKIKQVLEEQKGNFEGEVINASITKTGNGFEITESQSGITINVEESINKIKQSILEDWNKQGELQISLVSQELQPTIKKEDLQTIQSDPMASFTTSYTSSGSSRSANIDVAVQKINGSLLMPGEQFSCLEHMVPFTKENGYYPAGSYMGGKLVDSYGGGVCQVSTTLYNTVLLAELEVVQRNNHGLTVGSVQLSSDAAIAESSGMDFIFRNNTEYPIYIEGYTNNKKVTFQIYGNDQRPANRKIEYKNKIIEVLSPPADVITKDSSLPEGTRRVTQSSHTGYRAELYKYVYVDGVQQSVEKVNSSYYAPAPNYVTVGGSGVVQETEKQPETDSNGTPIETVPTNAPVDGTQNEGEGNQETTNTSSEETQPQSPTEITSVEETQPQSPTEITTSEETQAQSPTEITTPEETQPQSSAEMPTETTIQPETQNVEPQTTIESEEVATFIIPETQIIPETDLSAN